MNERRIPQATREAVSTAFPSLTISATPAPQGQNRYCCNFIFEDQKGARFLVKAIELNHKQLSHKGQPIDEVAAASVVRSHFVVPLLEHKTVGSFVFMRFPLLVGKNLAEYASEKGGVLSEGEVREIGISLLRGVSDLSRHKIVHQDIKPENIFVTDSHEVKILDFGSARYRKHSHKGSTNANRAHSSPEQLLAARPGNLQSLRLTCDERSDVFSVGSVLFQLLTGREPFDSNEHKLKEGMPTYPTELAISASLVRILNRMMMPHPRQRPRASEAILFLEEGDVRPPSVQRTGFYYNASTSIRPLKKVLANSPDSFQGIIVDASKFPGAEADYIKNGPLVTIVDPQTYLLQAPKLISPRYKKLEYYQLAKRGEVVAVENIRDNAQFSNAVLDFQMSSGADVLIAPNFLIREFNDSSWDLDTEMTHAALDTYKMRNIQYPILKGVALSENVLLSETTRGRMLDALTTADWSDSISGYFIVAECSQADSLPGENWLTAAKDLVASLLATQKAVVWSHAYLPMILHAHSGLGLGMGEGVGQRSFSLNEGASGIRIPAPYFYAPKALARMKWPASFRALNALNYGRLSEFICTDVCCAEIDFADPQARAKPELGLHMLHQLAKQFKRYSGPLGSRRGKQDLIHAISLYKDLRTHSNPQLRLALRNEFRPESGAFLEGWLNALYRG